MPVCHYIFPARKWCSLCHMINSFLTKFVGSSRLDIGLVNFLRVYGPQPHLGPYKHTKTELGLDLMCGQ